MMTNAEFDTYLPCLYQQYNADPIHSIQSVGILLRHIFCDYPLLFIRRRILCINRFKLSKLLHRWESDGKCTRLKIIVVQ